MGMDNHRLLAVDEDQQTLTLLEQAVRELGYFIETSPSAKQIEDLVREVRPDVVLLGMENPGPDNLQLIDRIKKARGPEETAIMIISDDESEKVKIKSLWHGADEYIQKPFNLAEMAIRLRNLIELKHYRQAMKEENSKLERERNRLARYFSDELIEKILNDDDADLAGANLTASMMFFDLRNSTGIGESLSPRQFSTFLSEIFTDIMDLVYGNHGSVNKMTGDGVFATFGCPVPSAEDAANCVRCALQIREYLSTYNDVRPEYLKEPLRAAMGIATGRVFAGNIGSVRHIEYSVVGDPVNVASRLEMLTKRANLDILIDGSTRDALGARVKVKRLRVNKLRGKQEDTRIFYLEDYVAEPVA